MLGLGQVAQTCIFSAGLRFPVGTAPRFPSVLRPVPEAARLDSPFGSMIADPPTIKIGGPSAAAGLRHPPGLDDIGAVLNSKPFAHLPVNLSLLRNPDVRLGNPCKAAM